MTIESHHASSGSSTVPAASTGPIVALLGPNVASSPLTHRLRDVGATAVPLQVLPGYDAPAAALVAALACDLAMVELPAAVGLDATTPRLWERLSLSGVPRAVVVTGLGGGGADFDDLSAIAQRVLGEDTVPVRLPVFDDDESVVGSFDLSRGRIDTAQGSTPAESGHLTVAAGDLSALLSVVAGTVVDDEAAGEYVDVIDRLAASGESAPAPPDGTIHLGMPALRGEHSSVPDRLAADLAVAVVEGLVAPIVADAPDESWLHDLGTWSATADGPADRLVRRDAHGDPTDGWAGVVLAVTDHSALIRPVFGRVEPGFALITAVGGDKDGEPVPHRAWPTELTTVDGSAVVRADRSQWWASNVRMSVGDTVASGHVWLLPAE